MGLRKAPGFWLQGCGGQRGRKERWGGSGAGEDNEASVAGRFRLREPEDVQVVRVDVLELRTGLGGMGQLPGAAPTVTSEWVGHLRTTSRRPGQTFWLLCAVQSASGSASSSSYLLNAVLCIYRFIPSFSQRCLNTSEAPSQEILI